MRIDVSISRVYDCIRMDRWTSKWIQLPQNTIDGTPSSSHLSGINHRNVRFFTVRSVWRQFSQSSSCLSWDLQPNKSSECVFLKKIRFLKKSTTTLHWWDTLDWNMLIVDSAHHTNFKIATSNFNHCSCITASWHGRFLHFTALTFRAACPSLNVMNSFQSTKQVRMWSRSHHSYSEHSHIVLNNNPQNVRSVMLRDVKTKIGFRSRRTVDRILKGRSTDWTCYIGAARFVLSVIMTGIKCNMCRTLSGKRLMGHAQKPKVHVLGIWRMFACFYEGVCAKSVQNLYKRVLLELLWEYSTICHRSTESPLALTIEKLD